MTAWGLGRVLSRHDPRHTLATLAARRKVCWGKILLLAVRYVNVARSRQMNNRLDYKSLRQSLGKPGDLYLIAQAPVPRVAASIALLKERHQRKGGEWAEQQRDQKPIEPASALPLREPGIDQCERAPTDEEHTAVFHFAVTPSRSIVWPRFARCPPAPLQPAEPHRRCGYIL